MTTLSIIEDTSDAWWPGPPAGLSARAAALPLPMVWRRIESWIAWRWGERPCTFILEGNCGAWRAPLYPFIPANFDVWHDAWEPVTLTADPFGGFAIGSASHYRVSGSLGSGDTPPDDVLEAYRRLAEYSAEKTGVAGSSSRTVELGGNIKESIERAPTWLARAMSYSGAADLLRPYRRAP